jgi:PIN domain nuclease of toxin-antitoxin system
MTLLLDTSIWIWFLEYDKRRLSSKTIEFLENAERGGELVVSDFSFWEVANKSAKGKLALSIDSAIWLERASAEASLTYLPVERSALILSTRLSGLPPNDPMDRILIATAQLNGATLVTTDAKIIDYARDSAALSVYDARK